MSRRTSGWGWPLAALLTLLGSIFMGIQWSGRNTAEAAVRRDIARQLSNVLHRERAYYQSNLAWAGTLADLDFRPRDPTWDFRVVATRVGEQPLLLLEADDGARRFCMDAQGTLFHSPLEPMPEVPPWLPAPQGGAHASAR